MNYDEMPAGPEIDQMVGLKCTDFESVYIRNGQCRVIRALINNAHDDEERWSPSTNIADAWEVVEVLDSEFGFSLSSPWFGGCSPGTVWRACCRLGDIVFYAVADTAPLAICRVTLLASGK